MDINIYTYIKREREREREEAGGLEAGLAHVYIRNRETEIDGWKKPDISSCTEKTSTHHHM